MPIYDNQISYEDMKKMVAAGETCGKCGLPLSIAWGGAHGYDGYILRCQDIDHNTTTRHDKQREKEINQIRRDMKLDSKSLMVMDKDTMLARVNMAKFPQDLKEDEKLMLAEVAITYGFDPLMKEVSIYQGQPYVSIDGRYRKAQETGDLDGVETRPATKQEREDWTIPEKDYFFRAEVYVKGAGRAFVGWGRVFEKETRPGSNRQGDTSSTFRPVQSNPQRMAEKRAEAQALRKAFHIPLPSAEDIGAGFDDEGDAATWSCGVVTVKGEALQRMAILRAEGEAIRKLAAPKKALKPVAKTKVSAEEAEAVLHQEKEVKDTGAEEPGSTGLAEPEVKASPIDMEWLGSQLYILQASKLASWTNAAVVKDLTSITGKEADSVTAAVAGLSREQAELFVKKVKETVELT